MSLVTFTLIHVAISLVGIFAGFAVLFGMFTAKPLPGWTALFLGATVATSVTGFFFPIHKFTPGLAIGALSLVILAVAIYALYARHLAGGWRKAYIITATVALYFNVFVAVVQAFEKVPGLRALAPTQTEPPFALAQIFVLVLFIGFGIFAVRQFRPAV